MGGLEVLCKGRGLTSASANSSQKMFFFTTVHSRSRSKRSVCILNEQIKLSHTLTSFEQPPTFSRERHTHPHRSICSPPPRPALHFMTAAPRRSPQRQHRSPTLQSPVSAARENSFYTPSHGRDESSLRGGRQHMRLVRGGVRLHLSGAERAVVHLRGLLTRALSVPPGLHRALSEGH